jgi:hypothetical protein
LVSEASGCLDLTNLHAHWLNSSPVSRVPNFIVISS